MSIKVDLLKDYLDYRSVVIEGVSFNDDLADAFISAAEFVCGTPLTDEELETLNEDSDLVYNLACKQSY